MVLPEIERHGPIAAWIIDDTGFPKKGAAPWKKARNEPCFGFIAGSRLYCWSRSLTVNVGTTVIAARGKARAVRS
jgi:hypothetical protein